MNHPFLQKYGIMGTENNPINRTTPQGAGNTERGLTIVSEKETTLAKEQYTPSPRGNKAPSEKHLEDWIVANPHLVHGEVVNLIELPIPDYALEGWLDLGNDNVAYPLIDHIIARQPRWPLGRPDLIVKTTHGSIAPIELKQGAIDAKAVAQCIRYMAGLKEIMYWTMLEHKIAKLADPIERYVTSYPQGEITGIVMGHSVGDKNLPVIAAYSNIELITYDYDPTSNAYSFDQVRFDLPVGSDNIFEDWSRGAIGHELHDSIVKNLEAQNRRKGGE